MWLFTSGGFVSIVASRDCQDDLIVRARVRNHLQALFPQAVITETVDADYRFRTIVNRKVVRKFVTDQVSVIRYGNFKNSISDPRYRSASNRVWGVMHELQGMYSQYDDDNR